MNFTQSLWFSNAKHLSINLATTWNREVIKRRRSWALIYLEQRESALTLISWTNCRRFLTKEVKRDKTARSNNFVHLCFTTSSICTSLPCPACQHICSSVVYSLELVTNLLSPFLHIVLIGELIYCTTHTCKWSSNWPVCLLTIQTLLRGQGSAKRGVW